MSILEGHVAHLEGTVAAARREDLFRVVALSATPGSDAKKVQSVLSNLQIAHIELRAEDDPCCPTLTSSRGSGV
ncbi:hypothetical protein B484DRAFT_397828 [Ochromonadaceae sp. CCMP2298]|nr:hypothetical protein B484DRAFT_397828 [Ochromonadaceae sp. CCMP2298]